MPVSKSLKLKIYFTLIEIQGIATCQRSLLLAQTEMFVLFMQKLELQEKINMHNLVTVYHVTF